MADRRSLRPERPNHVWAYDFVEERTHDGRRYRMLNIVDEFTREALAILDRRLRLTDVIETLANLFILRDFPATSDPTTSRSIVATAVKDWIAAVRRLKEQNRIFGTHGAVSVTSNENRFRQEPPSW
jgi:hypothetical protein